MDTMLIMVNENSPSETSSGKETEATTRKTSKKEKKKAQGREQSTRTHTGSNMEANTQVEQTVSKITNIEKRKKVGQTAKKTNNKEKDKKAIEKQQTVDKKARSSTRTESSRHHKAMQQSESTVEHPTVKKRGQNNSRKREHISNAVKSPKRQRNESSVPAKASVATHLAIDAMLSPGQNSGIVPSSEGNVDPDAGTDKVTGQFMRHEPPNTGESPNQPKKACDLEVSDRSLSSDGSESESQYEDGSLTDSDEDDMISEFSATQKKKSSLHQTRERLKRRNYRPEHRESVSKIIFDRDDDILIMEPPKPVPMSENKKDNTNSENSQSTKGVQGRPFMVSPYVSLKTQRANRRAAGGHQQSLTTSSSFIQGLIKNSIMKNVPEMMTSASTRVPVDGQTEEEPDPEDMWGLLPALPQQSSSSLAARAAKTSLQESGITETAATAPERPTTVTSTNISGAVITSKASKVMRSIWIESEEEEEDKDTEDTESLFMPTLPVASQLIQESTVLPSYSSLGPEHWMSVARAMQKRKKNSFLRLTFL
ncbi:uncharacterized protein LOC126997895 [Eriocheir sinensis]|uniref:uncharacterized protein LOC126997895 n=1 Tax=Eriocheir sinensis TaxID=95602 RepID=UPI0021CA2CE7|nr:uncharacterized protein LOC126997895 [Eriocheir sinensis]XP_050715068.1 uncharacterized protein LOC126997895 [Eriocheir sinensis]XP_050715069.1 uncharacterized protein LOC126997895 [Eriocheir sinensis]